MATVNVDLNKVIEVMSKSFEDLIDKLQDELNTNNSRPKSVSKPTPVKNQNSNYIDDWEDEEDEEDEDCYESDGYEDDDDYEEEEEEEDEDMRELRNIQRGLS